MGHYRSEMYSQEELTKEEIKAEKRKEQVEKRICKVLKIKRKELNIILEILEESRYY